MEIIEESEPGSRIVVGISLNAQASAELLSWVIRVVAKPWDTIVAIHILVCKEERKLYSDEKKKLRKAKAFVISLLGDFVRMSQANQVMLEGNVGVSSSIGRGLAQEAALSEAKFLIIGTSRNSNQKFFEITSHCFIYAPKSCSVVTVRTENIELHDLRSGIGKFEEEDNLSSSPKWHKKEKHHLFKSQSIIQKIFKAYSKKEKNHSLSKSMSTSEKSSPKAVLDGIELSSQQATNVTFSSPSSNSSSINRSNIWRRLSFVKGLLPSIFALEESTMKEGDAGSNYTDDQKPLWRCFGYDEISVATDNFNPENMVGRGGYAEVYKGTLGDGQTVAIKRLAKAKANENKESEFLTEFGILGHVCHPNTAYLVGCCIENGLYLIFDFCPNGTLASALHGKSGVFLDWPARYKITVGIARGLHYLHKCCQHRIIHRDIKASNVLLGEDFEPQISDFGLAKWLPKHWSHHSVLPIEGTFGYLAPEYFMHGVIDEKTDVFAFGVLLLEIVSGRRPVDCSKQSLLQWAKPLLEAGKIYELIDPVLGDNYDENQLKRLVQIASHCIRQPSIWRPSMSEVLDVLSESDDLRESQRWKILEQEIDEADDDSSVLTEFTLPY
ncbi:Protein kinase family protein [Rhynchospora pubera]|uniref:Protein kinase family protein n=1 Tax=Rhynchospora pubera TaxID=906938 RepID=A0AAV8D5Y6_9POAL|nr:Protein kinase family protein [Rhynchospora pubera]